MICFPLDNVEYEAEALGAWKGTRTRGVFAADTHYAVTANGNMSVNLAPGLAWLKAEAYWGVCVFEKNATTMQIDTADGSLTRWAAICLRLDKNLNDGYPIVKYGQFGTNPALSTLPLPEQNIDYDEIYVAAVRVRAGATEILTSDITDLRLNETYCGIMRDGVTGIPTQMLEDQWRAWSDREQRDFENWRNTERAVYELWAETTRANFELWMSTNKGDFESWSQTSKDQFYAWWEETKGIMDDDAAGHLLLLIEQIRPILGGADPTESTIGAVSQFYVNIDTGTLFVCIYKEGLIHTWLRVGSSGSVSSKAAVLGASHLGASYLM